MAKALIASHKSQAHMNKQFPKNVALTPIVSVGQSFRLWCSFLFICFFYSPDECSAVVSVTRVKLSWTLFLKEVLQFYLTGGVYVERSISQTRNGWTAHTHLKSLKSGVG